MRLVTRLIMLALVLASPSASGAAGDNFIGNQNAGKSLNIFTTTGGGAVTTAATVDSSQQWTIGAAGSNGNNTINGGQLNLTGAQSVVMRPLSGAGSPQQISFLNAPASGRYNFAVGNQLVTGNHFEFMFSAGADTSLFQSASQVGGFMDNLGQWTLGPATPAASSNLTLNSTAWTMTTGGLTSATQSSLQVLNTNGSGDALILLSGANGNARGRWVSNLAGSTIQFGAQTSGFGLDFVTNVTTKVGGFDSGGNWTFGVPTGNNTYTFGGGVLPSSTSTAFIDVKGNRVRTTINFNVGSGLAVTIPPACPNCGGEIIATNLNSGATAIFLCRAGSLSAGGGCVVVSQTDGTEWGAGTGAGNNNKLNFTAAGGVAVTNNNGGTRTYDLLMLWNE